MELLLEFASRLPSPHIEERFVTIQLDEPRGGNDIPAEFETVNDTCSELMRRMWPSRVETDDKSGFVWQENFVGTEFELPVLGKDVWSLFVQFLSWRRLLALRAVSRFHRVVVDSFLTRNLKTDILHHINIAKIEKSTEKSLGRSSMSSGSSAMTPHVLRLFFALKAVTYTFSDLRYSSLRLNKERSALRCCAADIKVKADKLNERFSDAQNASRRVKHGLLLLPKALARLQNAKAREASLTQDNIDLEAAVRDIESFVRSSFLEQLSTQINGRFRGRGMWGDQDAALKDHLLCRDVPVVAAQAARDEPLQDVVWSSEQRPAQSAEEWLSRVERFGSDLRCALATIKQQLEDARNRKAQLTQLALDMQKQAHDMDECYMLCSGVLRLLESAGFSIEEAEACVSKAVKQRQSLLQEAAYFRRRAVDASLKPDTRARAQRLFDEITARFPEVTEKEHEKVVLGVDLPQEREVRVSVTVQEQAKEGPRWSDIHVLRNMCVDLDLIRNVVQKEGMMLD